MRRQKLGLNEWVGCLLLLGLPFLVPGCYLGSRVTVAEGYRDGTVRKLSETGLVWKTWELESLGDGVRLRATKDVTEAGPETFAYTVADPDLVRKIEALPPGRRVRIHYRKKLVAWSPAGESRYFVTAVEVLPASPEGGK